MKALYLLIIVSAAIAALCAFNLTAGACDAYSFSSCAVYAPVQAYVQPVQKVYAPPQPVVSYYSETQEVILPVKVTVTRPEVRYEVQQVYGYAAPPLPVVYPLPVKSYGYSRGVQNFQGYNLSVQGHGYSAGVQYSQNLNQHHGLNFSGEDNRPVRSVTGPLGFTRTRQADGDLVTTGPLGNVRAFRKN